MKKFYLVLLCVLTAMGSIAQDFYWVGAATGNWGTAANWSATNNGAGGAGVPDNTSHTAIINRDAIITMDVADVDLSTLQISGGADVTLLAGSQTVLRLGSTNTAEPSLQIDPNSVLVDSTNADVTFETIFGDGAKARIDGDWRFGNLALPNEELGAIFTIPGDGSRGNRIDINGRMIIGEFADSPLILLTGNEYVFFNAGSEYVIESNGGAVPNVTWNATSTIRITGLIDRGTTFDENEAVGNVVYNSPLQGTEILLLDIYNIDVLGDLDIQNTNGSELTIVGNGASANEETVTVNILGDFNISGNSRVVLSNMNYDNKEVRVNVQGDFNAGGLSFDIQRNDQNVNVNTTVLAVAGTFNHSAGAFVVNSTYSDPNKDLYVVELNGTASQEVFSHTGSIDNSFNEVTLRLNNEAGAVLTSPLSVGRISFESEDKGVLSTTGVNLLTINNPSPGTLTVNSPNDSGYVDGPVRRNTNEAAAYVMPTGEAGNYRPVQATPNDVALSVYQAEYFASAYSDLSVQPPLRAVTNAEYWTLNRVSGSDAAVTLSVDGAIPNAIVTDEIVVARFDGNDWLSVKGTTGTGISNGTATAGDVRSQVLNTFGLFTLGLSNQGALPIELLTFTAVKGSGNTSNLSWTISTNSTPERFEVLRSTNGNDFVSIGSVIATRQTRYTYADDELPAGTTYYRLRLVDVDGTITLSKVVAVLNGGTGILMTSMIPTIVTSSATLEVTSSKKGNLQLVVTDLSGRIIHRQVAGINQGSQPVIMNLQQLSSGVYQVTGLFEGRKAGTIRFVKQ